LVEFEDVLVECCQGTLITPEYQKDLSRVQKLRHRFFPETKINLPQPASISNPQVLILVTLTVWDCQLLNYMPPDWRKRFDLVVAYVFDAAVPEYSQTEKLKIANSQFGKTAKLMDGFFMPVYSGVRALEETLKVPVSVVPLAADASKFGSNNPNRCIDVMGYGRQFLPHSQILEKTYNDSASSRIYYHTNHLSIEKINNFYEHRRMFWKLLNSSQIALAYDLLTTPREGIVYSFVGQRWFESLAAGCAIVGRRPACPEAKDLLDWEDATIEMPEDAGELIPFIEDLLHDKERLQSIRDRNYLNALARHDWRYRIADMLNYLGLEKPIPLQKSLADLQSKYERVKRIVSDRAQLERSNRK
jgi:hypothetical protein